MSVVLVTTDNNLLFSVFQRLFCLLCDTGTGSISRIHMGVSTTKVWLLSVVAASQIGEDTVHLTKATKSREKRKWRTYVLENHPFFLRQLPSGKLHQTPICQLSTVPLLHSVWSSHLWPLERSPTRLSCCYPDSFYDIPWPNIASLICCARAV